MKINVTNPLIFFFTIITLLKEIKLEKTRAILIGIDGFLTRCLNQAKTDGFEYLMSHGSYTYKARTAIEEKSGPGWSNILCGLDTEDTGVTSNEWNAPWFFGKPQNITPITGNDQPFPCAFQQFKNNDKNLTTVSLYSWEWFINLSNISIPGSIDKEIYCMMDGKESAIKCDIDAINDGVEIIKSKDFDFFFFYFGSLDETGHDSYFCSQPYIDRISDLNDYMTIIIEALKQAGIYDTTYVILTSDHGAEFNTSDHGVFVDDDNLLVPWIILGPNIKQNYEIQSEVKNADTMPTIFYAMGLKPSPLWRAIPVFEAFINTTSINENDKFLQLNICLFQNYLTNFYFF